MVFKFKIANMTGFLIEGLQISLQHSVNLVICPHQSAATTTIASISTLECLEWQVSARLMSFNQLPKIVLQMTLPSTENCPEDVDLYRIYTIPFTLKPVDLLLPDSSCMYFQPRNNNDGVLGNLKF